MMLTQNDVAAFVAWRTRYEKSGERWVTIGRGDEGGTPVKIDGAGAIVAGPASLAKKGIKKLTDFGGKPEAKSTAKPYKAKFPYGKRAAEKALKVVAGKNAKLEGVERLAGAPPGVSTAVMPHPYLPRAVQIDWQGEGFKASRFMYERDGDLYIENHSLEATGETGTGKGTAIFAQQVKEAGQMGVKAIKCTAGKDARMNGYYTWPRLGYDADIPVSVVSHLPREFAKATRVSDLMATKHGRDWWKENGVQTEMEFDPKPGSKSRKILDAYIAEREKDGRPIKMDYARPKPKEWEPEFDTTDDEILDRIWSEPEP